MHHPVSTYLTVLSPELAVLLTGLLIMGMDLRARPCPRSQAILASLGLLIGAGLCALLGARLEPTALWGGVFLSDPLSCLFRGLTCLVGAAALLLAILPLAERDENPGEFGSLVPFVALGGMLTVSAGELLTFFLAFELLSLPLYVMAAWGKGGRASSEAGLKYFLTGAVSSAVMLYGISLLFGSAGSTYLSDLGPSFLAQTSPPHAFLLGALMVLAGLAFKIAAAPFHLWAPDVLEGAPTPSALLISSLPKAVMVAVLLRWFWGHLALKSSDFLLPEVWTALFVAMALLSMTWGNLVALSQDNVKRMMACSGIAHIGYTLLGLAAASPEGSGAEAAAATIYYTAIYTVGNLTVWGVILLHGWETGSDRVEDYGGLAARSPFLALTLLLGLLSLAGLPPLAGFLGKLWIFRTLWEVSPSYWWLVLAAVVNSALSLYYYFRLLRAAYFAPAADPSPLAVPLRFTLILGSGLATLLILGYLPGAVKLALWAAAPLYGAPAP